MAVIRDGLPDALPQARAWHRTWHDTSDIPSLRASFTPGGAQLVYARQHGFNDWSAPAQHLQHIPLDATGGPFLAVFEAGQAGNW